MAKRNHRFDLDRYERIGPTSAERYRDRSTGKELSRRQMENVRASQAGFSSWSEYQRIRDPNTKQGRRLREWERMATEETGRSRRELRSPDSDFMQSYMEARRDKFKPDPHGSFALFLEDEVGVREGEAEYDVGDSA